MDLSEFGLEPAERVFRLPESAVRGAGGWLAGGIALVLFACVGFGVAIFTRTDQFSLHVMTTLPMLMGLGSIYAARLTRQSPREVGVGPAGVRITGPNGSETYGWDRIGWAMVEAAPLNNRRLLRIFDTEGRTLAQLSDAIEGFDAMADAIRGRIAARGDSTTERLQLQKARKSSVFMACAGVGFLALAGAVAWNTSQELRAERLLKQSAVRGEAQIERRFLAPNGVTPRLEYRVTTPDGKTATRNAELERPAWDALANAQTVPVLYVPGEPEISRLVSGEAEDRDLFKNPLVGYGLPIAVALMSLLFLVASVLMWRGMDIDVDSKTGRMSIKRFGTGS